MASAGPVTLSVPICLLLSIISTMVHCSAEERAMGSSQTLASVLCMSAACRLYSACNATDCLKLHLWEGC